MASKIMFKASGGFYNTRAFQRTLNQGHRMRRKKVRNENEARLNSKDFLNFQVSGVFLMFFEVFLTKEKCGQFQGNFYGIDKWKFN